MMLITKTPTQTRSEPPIPKKKPPKSSPISLITSHKSGNANAKINSIKNAIAVNFSILPMIYYFKHGTKIQTA